MENILLLISDSCPPAWVEELKENLEKKTGFIARIIYISDDPLIIHGIPERWKKGKYASGKTVPLRGKNDGDFTSAMNRPVLIIDLCGGKADESVYDNLPVLRCSLFDEARGQLHAVLLKAVAGNSPTVKVDILLHHGNQRSKLIKRGCFKTVLYDYRKSLDIILENLIVLIPSAAGQHHLAGGEFVVTETAFNTSWQSLVDGCRKNEKRQRLMHRVRLLATSETWNTGFIRFPIEKVALQEKTNWEVEWDKELAPGSFRADPFGIDDGDGRRMVIFEKFSRNTGRLIVEHNGMWSEPLPEPDVHRSYPYLFRYKESWYCLPEQKAAKKLSLYRVDKKTGELIHDCDILEEIEAADPSMIFLNDRWWLFFTDTAHKGADLRLCIYHAIRPEGPWTPHALNPVKTDITGARPAGHLFIHNGTAYRPAQDSSLTYGGSIRVHRIDVLTPDKFEESEVNHLQPEQLSGSYHSGWHTISICGDGCLVDGKRSITDPLKLLRKYLS